MAVVSLSKRGRVKLPTGIKRHEAMVRTLQDQLNRIRDDVNALIGQLGTLRNTSEASPLAAHAEQHQTGGADEVYFSRLERSLTDARLHDAFREGPHVTDVEHAQLAGTADITWSLGVGPVMSVSDGISTRRYRWVLDWNTSTPTPRPIPRLQEVV